MAALSFFLFFVFSLIPTIFNKPYLNYILNFLIVTTGLTISTNKLKQKEL